MKEYYCAALGLKLLDERDDRFTVAAGRSRVTFVAAPPGAGRPFYHFAFNIPENKVLAAREWQRRRGPLMPVPPRLRDPAYPDDVVHFSHWNAHSVFFYDPAGNVVEYIARHDLKNAAPGAFASGDILYASEIALVVDDVRACAAKIKDVVGVEQYRGGDEQFAAVGDEHGLLLVMKHGRVLNFDPDSDEKAARVFGTVVHVRGTKRAEHAFEGFPYRLVVGE